MNPSSQLHVLREIRRNQAVAVRFLEGDELTVSFQPGGFVRIPAKPDLVKFSNTFKSHVGLLSLFEECVVPPLLFRPKPELGVLRVGQRDVTVPVLGPELLQILQMPRPSRLLRVPGKAEILQQCNALRRDTALLAVLQELILLSAVNPARHQAMLARQEHTKGGCEVTQNNVPLFCDPACKLRVLGIPARDDAISELILVNLQLFKRS